jgi:hypothetical protein
MHRYFERALANITRYGDTDIFPFPIESHVFYDKQSETISLLMDYYSEFAQRLANSSPANINALVPIGYTGFRSATQIDPIWNAFFLGLVLSISDDIERARLPKQDNIVFSYRLNDDSNSPDLFDQNYNWRSFMEASLGHASNSKFVVTCDISEFYPRLNHHRLDNALRQLRIRGDQPKKIMDFLSNYSGTYSFGLPVGGPAARILSELLLNQIDRLLRAEGIRFSRFADDFHLYANSYEEAFKALLFLSEKLLDNQGLQLQKAKTRIMSGQEFIATSPLHLDRTDSPAGDRSGAPNSDAPDLNGAGSEAPAVASAPNLEEQSQNLLRLSVRFDPYSPTAEADYELLKDEVGKIDLIPLLRAELLKSRVHISLSKKIVAAIRYINDPQRGQAILSLIEKAELLYPVYANVLFTAKSLYDDLSANIQEGIIGHVRTLLKTESHVLQTELHLCYAVRLLSCSPGPENEEVLNKIYRQTNSLLVRRDIILAMAKWGAAYWLSNLKTEFRTISRPERRAFIVASYILIDEGKHWRQHIAPELFPLEILIRDWASEKIQIPNWTVPL